MKVFERTILLASRSPRRLQLLKEAGFRVRLCPNDVEEHFPHDLPRREVAAFLAEEKARHAEANLLPGEILLTADSIVLMDDIIYGKPADRQEAITILQQLSGNTHEVITGVCLSDGEQRIVFDSTTKVTFHPLTEEEIEFYVDRYEPFDKAGAYGVQDWIGLCKVAHMEGTYSNVMGLPMEAVYHKLVEHFV